eukprot:3915136-Pyramimonas_sp.AAC.1
MQWEESARGQADRADPPTARHTQCNNFAKLFQKILATEVEIRVLHAPKVHANYTGIGAPCEHKLFNYRY